MPSNIVRKVSEKCDLTKDRVEYLWDKAEKLAKKQGHEKEYDYIMGIFKKMIGNQCKNKLGWACLESFGEADYEDFKRLAKEQRGEPEKAMKAIQRSQISQLYGYVAEHLGDIINRMAQDPDFFKGYHDAVKDKLHRVLRNLRQPYGFEKEVLEQIESNLDYNQSENNWKNETEDSLLKKLKRLSRNYAKAFNVLTTYNDAQQHAKEAAVAFGNWHFDDAIDHLEILEKYLKDEETWRDYALQIEASGRCRYFNASGGLCTIGCKSHRIARLNYCPWDGDPEDDKKSPTGVECRCYE